MPQQSLSSACCARLCTSGLTTLECSKNIFKHARINYGIAVLEADIVVRLVKNQARLMAQLKLKAGNSMHNFFDREPL